MYSLLPECPPDEHICPIFENPLRSSMIRHIGERNALQTKNGGV